MSESKYYQGRRFVSSPDDLPPGEHLVILTFSTITIPGDERSRTHPGHGYPESTETTISCEAFETEEGWKAEIQRLAAGAYPRTNWVPLTVRRPTLKTTVTVDIG